MSTIEQSQLLGRYASEFASSNRLHQQASDLFPNGITHDIRYLQPFPIYVSRAEGSRKWDVDGHELVDWWSGHGALMFGHSHPAIVEAVAEQIKHGTHLGACHQMELEWGNLVRELFPSVEKLRFTNSGTEATMMALRLARTYTNRPRVLKFRGHFHGWNDFLIQDAAPPYSQEVPGLGVDLGSQLTVIPPNDLNLVDATLARAPDIGSVIIEPTGGHFGQVPVQGEFLRGLRELTRKHNVLLICDEVITGFRVAPGGAQGYYGIDADLTTMAKILAGGLPGGCVGGRADILDLIAIGQPAEKKMPHQGTFNANPISAAAGIVTLKMVRDDNACERANALGHSIRTKLNRLFESEGIPWIAYGEFSAFYLLTGYHGPRGDDVLPYGGDFEKLDAGVPTSLKHAFRIGMLLSGADLPGLRGMTNAAHSEEDVDITVEAVGKTIQLLRQDGLID